MKYQEFKKSLKKPYFSQSDLKQRNLKVFLYQLSSWTQKEYIGTLKKSMHYFIDETPNIKPEEIAFFIYNPSYISMECALSHYGLIPEAIFSITSVTSLTNRHFKNKFGNFFYRHLSPSLFFGYNSVGTKYGKYLLAEPEKAMLDYFYLNSGRIEDETDIEELRINTEVFNKIINKKKLNEYLKVFHIKKLDKIINLLIKSCSH